MKTHTLLLTFLFVLGIIGSGFSQSINCDNFTTANWPQNTYTSGDTVGYTQNASLPITLGTSATAYVNSNDPGIYLLGAAQFDMNGSNQSARFEIYGLYNQYSQMGFSVNGSAVYYMDDTFPLTIGNVTVDLDTSVANIGNWLNAYLTFSGPLNEVIIDGFESGVVELCIEDNPFSGCDNFTTANWPQNTYTSGDTVGYTQNASLPITLGTSATAYVNSFDPGIYLLGAAQFDMNGSNQSARFEIYGWYNQYSQMGFSVNGSAVYYMDDTFPLTIGNVTVDLDTSAANIGNWLNAYLTFSGPLNEVIIDGFESGVVELCIEDNPFSGCDNFTTANWPQNTYTSGDTVGYTQNASLPITLGTSATAYVNSFDPGIYLLGAAQFDMNGANQSARFEIYGLYNQYSQMGFSVNGSAVYYMDDTFPLTIGNVTVDLDTSAANIGNWLNAYLTFSGPLNEVIIDGFESGVVELCIEDNPFSGCDNFTTANWPQNTYTSGDTVGYTQNASLPITLGTSATAYVNSFDSGIYLLGAAQFDMNGSNQSARFEIYGWYNQYSQMGFSVNGSAVYYMDDTFPLTIGNVTIDLDTSAANIGNWLNAYLTFSGPLNEVTIDGFESGVVELCVDEIAGVAENGSLEDFTVFPNPASETATVTSAINLDEIAIYSISGSLVQKIFPENSTTVNVDISELKPGVYLIMGKSKGAYNQSSRLIVQ